MSTATSVPLTDYLKTSYRPDREYIDGELLERNVGEWEHSDLQTAIAAYLRQRRNELGIQVVVEQRVQVKPTRFRIPDVTVLVGPRPAGGIVTDPPFLCIEILSPEDRIREMRERVDDYLNFGVRYVWVIDPVIRRASIYSGQGVREVHDGVFSTESPNIVVRLADLE
ncbi:Uma2 family endonuclease [Nevskia soli]|jgi:Uma2 family endonuclease|uniref:Uma2 family endonuclease n=1 Tax=Nevskia soli TaxID=418856 RepID=UPI0015D7208E|nr:Uma2 family endonuclease [Nevskia soli]